MLAGAHQACRRGEGRVRAAADTAKVLGDVTGEGLQRTWVSMAREFYLIRREVADVCLRVIFVEKIAPRLVSYPSEGADHTEYPRPWCQPACSANNDKLGTRSRLSGDPHAPRTLPSCCRKAARPSAPSPRTQGSLTCTVAAGPRALVVRRELPGQVSDNRQCCCCEQGRARLGPLIFLGFAVSPER